MKICVQCHKEYSGKNKKLCSRSCFILYEKANHWNRGKKAANNIQQPLPCFECGKTIYRTPRHIMLYKRAFCSLTCKYKNVHLWTNQEKNTNWKGGISLDPSTGYIRIQTGRNKTRAQHRLVMEAHLKRSLDSSEVVHHTNSIKTDNRIENLEVMTRSEHMRLHAKRRWDQWKKEGKEKTYGK